MLRCSTYKSTRDFFLSTIVAVNHDLIRAKVDETLESRLETIFRLQVIVKKIQLTDKADMKARNVCARALSTGERNDEFIICIVTIFYCAKDDRKITCSSRPVSVHNRYTERCRKENCERHIRPHFIVELLLNLRHSHSKRFAFGH